MEVIDEDDVLQYTITLVADTDGMTGQLVLTSVALADDVFFVTGQAYTGVLTPVVE